MKKLKDILNESVSDLLEATAKSPIVSKGIYTMDGRKINMERQSKLTLESLNEDDSLTALTWAQYKKLNVPSTSSSAIEDEFVTTLIHTIKQFNHKVDANGALQRIGKNGKFEDKVDSLLQHGAKLTKSGLKRK